MAEQKQWELEALVTMMVAKKVLKVRMGGLEVELSPDAFATAPDTNAEETKSEPIPDGTEMLFLSGLDPFATNPEPEHLAPENVGTEK